MRKVYFSLKLLKNKQRYILEAFWRKLKY